MWSSRLSLSPLTHPSLSAKPTSLKDSPSLAKTSQFEHPENGQESDYTFFPSRSVLSTPSPLLITL